MQLSGGAGAPVANLGILVCGGGGQKVLPVLMVPFLTLNPELLSLRLGEAVGFAWHFSLNSDLQSLQPSRGGDGNDLQELAQKDSSVTYHLSQQTQADIETA